MDTRERIPLGEHVDINGRRIRIKTEIGSGASSIVYRGRDEDKGKEVIVKEFYPLEMAEFKRIKNFQFDIKAKQAGLAEQQLDSFTDGYRSWCEYMEKSFFCSMDPDLILCKNDNKVSAYIITTEKNGYELARVNSADFEPELYGNYEQLIQITNALINRLAPIHADGKLYLDLKPENVFLFNNSLTNYETRSVALFDFDSVLTPEMALAQGYKTTRCFSPPDEIPSEQYDVYTVGGILLWLLTGASPRGYRNLFNHLNEGRLESYQNWSLPGKSSNPLYQKILEVLKGSLAPDQNYRYKSLSDMQDALFSGLDISRKEAAPSEAEVERFRREYILQIAQFQESLKWAVKDLKKHIDKRADGIEDWVGVAAESLDDGIKEILEQGKASSDILTASHNKLNEISERMKESAVEHGETAKVKFAEQPKTTNKKMSIKVRFKDSWLGKLYERIGLPPYILVMNFLFLLFALVSAVIMIVSQAISPYLYVLTFCIVMIATTWLVGRDRKKKVEWKDGKLFQPFTPPNELRDPWKRNDIINSILKSMHLTISSKLDKKKKVIIVIGESGAGKSVVVRKLLEDEVVNTNRLLKGDFDSADQLYSGEINEVALLPEERQSTAEKQIAHKAVAMSNLFNSMKDSGYEGFETIHVRYYEEEAFFKNRRRKYGDMVEENAKNKKLTIIFLDQFEQLFISHKEQYPSEAERREIEKEFDLWIENTDAIFVISLRYEWSYRLKLFGCNIARPEDYIQVPQLTEGVDLKAVNSVRDKYILVTNKRKGKYANDIKNEILNSGSSTPLVFQIVGAFLEQEQYGENGKTFSPEEWKASGGYEGAVNNFFIKLLESSPNQEVALKVFCALSAERDATFNELSSLLFLDAYNLRAVLDHLVKRKVVESVGNDKYKTSHDYVDMCFSSVAAARLNAVERENVLSALINKDGGNNNVFIKEAAKEAKRKVGVSVVIVMTVALMVLATARLVIADSFWLWPPYWDFLLPLIGDKFLDAAYLPLFLCSYVWACYVAEFYTRVLSKIDKEPSQKLGSIMVVFAMFLCIIAPMFIPSVWLVTIGLGGVAVGLRFLAISKRKDLNSYAKRYFLEIARPTLFNAGLVVFFGIMGLYFVGTTQLLLEDFVYHRLVVMLVASCANVYACALLERRHLSPQGASLLLGVLQRPKSTIS